MPSISYKGVNVHFEDEGNGPAIVLLHGFLESNWMWQEIAPVLTAKARIIQIELLGHGLTDCTGYVHEMDEMAEAVEAVLKSLKIRKVSIVGHSMGGYVALAFADLFPDMVRKLVLYQSTARSDDEWKKKDRLRAIDIIKQNHESFIRQSIPMLFRPKNRAIFKEKIAILKTEALKTSKQGVIAALQGMRTRPNRELILKFAPYPVHIIAGDKDPRIPINESTELAEISDHVHLHVIKGSGHMSYIEDLDSTLQIFRKILP